MRSQAEYLEMAERVLPGGGLGTRLNPEGLRVTIASANGSHLTDVDGREWIDYVCGAGALILGHQHPEVVAAVRHQAARSIHQYGSLTDVSIELAVQIVEAIPGAERMVFTTTGSEATAYAMRLARAHTGRPKIVKFEGGFHGNHDYAGVGVSPPEPSPYPRSVPFTSGTPEAVIDTMLVTPYNDLERLRDLLEREAEQTAAVIVEPVQRIIRPDAGFLEGVRRLCDEFGIVLIFDEVVTGFRLAYGGAQEYFGVKADLAGYGKILGGGGPVGAVVGRSDIIDRAHPGLVGRPEYVYASGTLHGNPLGAAAGIVTLKMLRTPGFYAELETRMQQLGAALTNVFHSRGYPARIEHVGSMWQPLHLDGSPRSYVEMLRSDRNADRSFDVALLESGINVVPALRRFISAAHTDTDFDRTVAAVDRICGGMKR